MSIVRPLHVSTMHPVRMRLGIQEGVQSNMRFGKEPAANPQQPAGDKRHRGLIWLITSLIAAGIGGNAFQSKIYYKNMENYSQQVDSKVKSQDRLLEYQNQLMAEHKAKTDTLIEKHKMWIEDEISAQAQRAENLSAIIQSLHQSVDSVITSMKGSLTLDRIVEVVEKVAPATVRVEGAQALGSGVIVKDADNKRYILTNGHVVEKNALRQNEKGQNMYRIKLYNGSDRKAPAQFEAGIVKLSGGRNAESPGADQDLALLEIPATAKLPDNIVPIELRDVATHPIRPGEVVIAIGNPIGLKDSVTCGIVSHVDRNFGVKVKNNFLQVDAPINSGNSGGGLFDMQGRLIGINTISADKSQADGLSGSIRIDSVIELLNKWGIPIKPTSG